MTTWISTVVLALAGGVGARIWYRRWRQRRVAARRRLELPNSHYSSAGVRCQEDRERWGAIRLARLHPLNREEVSRLLALADERGVDALSPRDRLFLDNMTLRRREG